MTLSLFSLVFWLVLSVVAAGAAGLYPTWRLTGAAGLHSQLSAGVIVLVVNIACGYLVVRKARRGPGAAAFTFISMGMIRMVVGLALMAAVWRMFELNVKAGFIWLALFYLIALIVEGVWLVGAVRRVISTVKRPGCDQSAGPGGGNQTDRQDAHDQPSGTG